MNTREELRRSAAEYVLGTMDATERAAMRDWMAADPDVAALVRMWEHRFSPLLELSAPARLPSTLLDDILAKLPLDLPAKAPRVPLPVEPAPPRPDGGIANGEPSPGAERPADSEAGALGSTLPPAAAGEPIDAETERTAAPEGAPARLHSEPASPASAEAPAQEALEVEALETEPLASEPLSSEPLALDGTVAAVRPTDAAANPGDAVAPDAPSGRDGMIPDASVSPAPPPPEEASVGAHEGPAAPPSEAPDLSVSGADGDARASEGASEGRAAPAAPAAPMSLATPSPATPPHAPPEVRETSGWRRLSGVLMLVLLAGGAAIAYRELHRPPPPAPPPPTIIRVEAPPPPPPPPEEIADAFAVLGPQPVPAIGLTLDVDSGTVRVLKLPAPPGEGLRYDLWLVGDQDSPRRLASFRETGDVLSDAVRGLDRDRLADTFLIITREPEAEAGALPTGTPVYSGMAVAR